MKRTTLDNWFSLFATTSAAFGIIVSWVFSAKGFGTLAQGYEWVGYIIIMNMSALQFEFKKYGHNMDLWLVVGAYASYLYDIGSNVLGFAFIFGFTLLWKDPAQTLVCLFVSVMLSCLPEPLLRQGLENLDIDIGAILNRLIDATNGRKPNQARSYGNEQSNSFNRQNK